MQESLFSCPAQHQPMRCADTRARAGLVLGALEKPDGEEILRDSREEWSSRSQGQLGQQLLC